MSQADRGTYSGGCACKVLRSFARNVLGGLRNVLGSFARKVLGGTCGVRLTTAD